MKCINSEQTDTDHTDYSEAKLMKSIDITVKL